MRHGKAPGRPWEEQFSNRSIQRDGEMRQGQGSKRSRGRGGSGGRRNVSPRHQNFDSNGPSIRIRGNAHQVYEKYLQLARDAYAAGDRVMAENMYQHAEHYFRIINVDEGARAPGSAPGPGGAPRNAADSANAPNRGNGADPRHAQRQPRRDDASERPGERSGEQPAEQSAASAQPVDAVQPAQDGEAEAARAPRRTRRNDNRPRRARPATPPADAVSDSAADAVPAVVVDAAVPGASVAAAVQPPEAPQPEIKEAELDTGDRPGEPTAHD